MAVRQPPAPSSPTFGRRQQRRIHRCLGAVRQAGMGGLRFRPHVPQGENGGLADRSIPVPKPLREGGYGQIGSLSVASESDENADRQPQSRQLRRSPASAYRSSTLAGNLVDRRHRPPCLSFHWLQPRQSAIGEPQVRPDPRRAYGTALHKHSSFPMTGQASGPVAGRRRCRG